jgi:hypothetical protein
MKPYGIDDKQSGPMRYSCCDRRNHGCLASKDKVSTCRVWKKRSRAAGRREVDKQLNEQ